MSAGFGLGHTRQYRQNVPIRFAVMIAGLGFAAWLLLPGAFPDLANAAENTPKKPAPSNKDKTSKKSTAKTSADGQKKDQKKESSANSQPPKESDVTYLDDLEEASSHVHYGSLGKHGATSFKAPDIQKCRLGGKVLKHALAMHPPNSGAAFATYALDGGFDQFRGVAAMNTPVAGDGLENAKKFDYKGVTRTPVTFRVLGDERVLWVSRPLQKHGESQD